MWSPFRPAKEVIVGGGSGFVGQCIAEALRRKGYAPRIVSRQGGPNGALSWNDIKTHGLPKDTVGVINVAGTLIIQFTKPFTAAFQADVRASRIDTTTILADAMGSLPSQAHKRPLICTSAVGYYETDSDMVLDERSPMTNSFFGRLCADIEHAAMRASDNVRVCAVRPGVVYGPHGGAWAQMKLPFSLGVGGVLGSGTQFVPWIHVEDLARLYVHLLETESAHGPYNGVAPSLATNRDFTKAVCAELTRPTLVPVPGFV
jgi:uncharacterized protein (TIGR01777 family)